LSPTAPKHEEAEEDDDDGDEKNIIQVARSLGERRDTFTAAMKIARFRQEGRGGEGSKKPHRSFFALER
jgi:hypothetical protein